MVKLKEDIIDIEEFKIDDNKNSNKKKKVIRQDIYNPKKYYIPFDFWKNNNLIFQIDDTLYFEMEKYLTPEKISLKDILEKYKYEICKDFDKRSLWFLIKFFFIMSDFYILHSSKNPNAIFGGVPQKLSIKCKCGKILKEKKWLKGHFDPSRKIHLLGAPSHLDTYSEHEFYLRISEKCPNCKDSICIYRPKRGVLQILMIFLDSIIPDLLNLNINYNLSNINILMGWCTIVDKFFQSNLEPNTLYQEDLLQFVNLIKDLPSISSDIKTEIFTKFKFLKFFS